MRNIGTTVSVRGRTTGVAAALGIVGLAVCGIASASCPGLPLASATKGQAQLIPAVYHPDGSAGFIKIGGQEGWVSPIVGLWTVEFIAEGNTNGIPDDALIDFGTATWHEDGTEEMVSGGRDPSTGDVCMGVWEHVGHGTFKLTHLALAWKPGAYVGPTKIIETVTLDPSGNSFHGRFTITAYAGSMTPGGEFTEGTPLAPTPIYGKITGKRVNAD